MQKFKNLLIMCLIVICQVQAIEPPPSQDQAPPSSNQTPSQSPMAGSSTYSGTITPGAKSLTNVDEMPPEFPPSPGTATSQEPSSPSGTVSTPSSGTATSQVPSGTASSPSSGTTMPQADPNKTQMPSGTIQTPSGTVQTPSGNTCSMLKNPEHLAFANKLEGNEQILFCSIFDDSQREQVLFYAKNKQMTPKDAVIQVGKDAGLLFSQTPGGACGAH